MGGETVSDDQTANKTAIAIADYFNSLDVLQPLAYYMARGLPEKLAQISTAVHPRNIDKSNIPIEWSDVRGIPCSHMSACIFYLPDSRLSQCISDVPTIGGKSNGEIE